MGSKLTLASAFMTASNSNTNSSISFKIIRIAPLTDDGEGRGQNEGGDGDGGPGHVREPVHVDRVIGSGPLVPRAVQADSTSGKQVDLRVFDALGRRYLLIAAVFLNLGNTGTV